MNFDEQKRIVQHQRAGFAALRQFQIDAMRRATFADRLDAFARVMGFAELLNRPVSRLDDNQLAERWIRIRQNYAAKT